jgi:hypothetical protein
MGNAAAVLEESKIYQKSYPYYFQILCLCIVTLYFPRFIVDWGIRGNHLDDFRKKYNAKKDEEWY